MTLTLIIVGAIGLLWLGRIGRRRYIDWRTKREMRIRDAELRKWGMAPWTNTEHKQ